MKQTELISINGRILPAEDAKISVFDRGFLYGDAVYEVCRSYDRIFFEAEAHLQRLFRSAEAIAMDLKTSPEEYLREIYRVYSHSKNPRVYMRIQVTRGEGHIGLHPNTVVRGPNVVIWIRNLEEIPEEYYSKGLRVVTTDRIRNPKRALDPNVKSGNYLNNVLGYFEAAKKGVNDAIMVNDRGELAEATLSNVFIVRGGKVVDMPDTGDLLHGITRGVVGHLCRSNGIGFEKRAVSVGELEAADEAFLTSTLREVMPITEVNGKRIGSGLPGSVTTRLGVLFKEYVESYVQQAMKRHPVS